MPPLPPPHTLVVIPPIQNPLFDHPPVRDVRVIPGLPNPNTNRVYRLQIGAYSSIESAARAIRQLEAAGFQAAQEMHNNMYRVAAIGIPAPQVQGAIQRLGAIGFGQIWVRE
jgi:cell division protein FtsN